MKKLICVLLLVVMMTSLLAGCIGSFTCDVCGEDKFGIYTEEEILGEKITYCSDCKDEVQEVKDMLGSLG